MLARIAASALMLACVVLAGCSGGPVATNSYVSASGSPGPADQTSGDAVAPAAPSASGCGSDPAAPGSTSTVTVTVNGEARSARLHVPSAYDPAKAATPVILAFVGHGMSIDELEGFSGFDDSDALVLYPQPAGSSPQNGWQGAPYASGKDDVAFVAALLDHVQEQNCVDSTRVYAAGISNGAGFVSLLSCRVADRIAAFAAVSAAMYPTDNPPCPSVPAVPIVEFHGTADPVIPYDGGTSHGTTLEPVTRWLDEQAQRAGCAASPTRTPIGSDVLEEQWSGCQGRGALIHYTIDGGGHTWPGASRESGPGATTSTISATQIIEDFFAAHSLG